MGCHICKQTKLLMSWSIVIHIYTPVYWHFVTLFCTVLNWYRCKTLAKEYFASFPQPSPAFHNVHAISNCHIDTGNEKYKDATSKTPTYFCFVAWLWPYSETVTKCARSWSSALRLIEDHPNMSFACSQVGTFIGYEHYVHVLYLSRLSNWIGSSNITPACMLVSRRVLSREGLYQWEGHGWRWYAGHVKSTATPWSRVLLQDGNIPSGESFVRQFLIGQNFFKEEFGSYCSVVSMMIVVL